ncbi:hypothetical protein C8F04DRAFT_1194940 [Mycena alexandri]|uniref:Uncharacterized protein n=1 Tax=Mycena alexandri TaxID=1745969 RepID=A0AAD6WR13_9AGAR|nr:hypothetical protein C8F04DRAFT_1194940 [Mycena alexandri]
MAEGRERLQGQIVLKRQLKKLSTIQISPPATLTVPAVVAAVLPNAKDHRAIFAETIENEGSYEAAVAYFEDFYKVVNSGVVFGAALPPPDVILSSIDVGRLTVFYHSTFPADLQRGNAFTWNFYIGLRGAGAHSIMSDWSKRGIVVRIPGLARKWEECQVLIVLACTRVRISYPEGTGATTHELVFPPDPNEADIPVHYLKEFQVDLGEERNSCPVGD